MSELDANEGSSLEEKPVIPYEDVKFPPFPDPSDKDFDDDLSNEEKLYYKQIFPDINAVVKFKLHCTACDRHLGCSARNDSRMRQHPMLRTLICHTCHSFYNSGEFDRGEDGSELYCRWCGQGGQVYCCSDCIHVFCAKCIKRNFGVAKIKEIENTDDWKCFKCNPRCLWDMRAVCWALLRFCDIRNKIVHHTEDPELKEKYLRAVSTDTSECCKNKGRRKEKIETRKSDSAKKKDKEVKEVVDIKKTLPKLPPSIQVKKFASINMDETPKKAVKRPASPKKLTPGFIQKPITIAPCNLPSPTIKKVRMSSAPLLTPLRMVTDRKITSTYTRVPIKQRPTFPIQIPQNAMQFNGLQNPFAINLPSLVGDNINLSLETLTQGLDMAAMAAFNNNAQTNAVDNDVVCTPDFPLEPLCEVTEDNDDDVECITPGPVVPPKINNNPPSLISRTLPEFTSENIVQMTENDVTVNTVTGGLKFRVDPQTLSSKKMYRLPDGRIFAINPNPNMPGGYSATIVSVSESGGKTLGGETFAAKLSAVTSSASSGSKRSRKQKLKTTPVPKPPKTKEVEERRAADFKVPVEWYRYNLIDAVDALDYSLSRLNKLKKETTTGYLRTRSVDEIKYLHRTLEQLLTTSSKRFLEIRENLNKELKQYISKKMRQNNEDGTEDDDDVEFLPNAGNDDPIFIDENSIDSVNVTENQEVDLTGVASSEHNDSAENKNDSDPLLCHEESIVDGKDDDNTVCVKERRESLSPNNSEDNKTNDKDDDADMLDSSRRILKSVDDSGDIEADKLKHNQDVDMNLDNIKEEISDKYEKKSTEKRDVMLNNVNDKHNNENDDVDETSTDIEGNMNSSDQANFSKKTSETNGEVKDKDDDLDEQKDTKNKADVEKEIQDSEMSEEMIESLLKDNDSLGDVEMSNTNSVDDLGGVGDKQ